ncbi:DUF3822 family protein [Polaribacter sp.]|nr:DUF3822 family protein [Polaribacter sp.]
MDGFSFSVYNIISKKEVYFREYEFENSQVTPENLLLKIKDIFNTDTQLQNDFSSVLVIHQNNLSVLVPNRYFNEKELASYLNFNVKKLTIDYVAFDHLKVLESKNIYIPYVNINNYLFQNFGEFEYKHHSTVFIEKLLTTTNNIEKTVVCTLQKRTLLIILLKHQKVIIRPKKPTK